MTTRGGPGQQACSKSALARVLVPKNAYGCNSTHLFDTFSLTHYLYGVLSQHYGL